MSEKTSNLKRLGLELSIGLLGSQIGPVDQKLCSENAETTSFRTVLNRYKSITLDGLTWHRADALVYS